MKIGSLFDGSGTAPLAAAMCGIEPAWASEIEPYPLRVTTARFPHMKHLGDITAVNGAEIEPVDIICGGSPCQDLSVAGKQAGLHNGKRSHLFFEMTRIITEMREATNGRYPRYIIWENVPGAFGSNKGRDFLAVLQAFAEIAAPDVHVPEPEEKSGRLRWKYAGEMVGDGWSIAWRTVDAQYWGVPQRRRRIYLVADFGSDRAGEILFERTSLSRDSDESGETRKGASPPSQSRTGRTGGTDLGSHGAMGFPLGFRAENTHLYDETSTTICNGTRPGFTAGVIYQNTGRGWWNEATVAETLRTPCDGDSLKSNLVIYDARGNGDGKIVPTLTGDHQNRITDYTAIAVGNGQLHQISMSEQANTLDCMHDVQAVLITEQCGFRFILRRLVPLECCRLQGFPDWWTEGCEAHPLDGTWATNPFLLKWVNPTGAVEGSDSAKYKMWGNGMALPNMLHVMRGIRSHHLMELLGA